MFHVGQKIAYPMHGAGIIESIEDREIFGTKKRCYIIKMLLGDIKVIIPLEESQSVGIRTIASKTDFKKVINILLQPCVKMSDKWNIRFRENEAKLKQGHILEIAKILNYLNHMDRAKKLSTGEKKMYTIAQQILISELALIKDIEYEEMERRLSELLNIY